MLDTDRYFMHVALELAKQGQGFVEPNPMVGCVLVQGAQIVGEGFHTRFGAPHAEIEALRDAGDQAEGATCYVTLEPCAHHGKTPPCADALVQAKIGRLVIAMTDPFPKVDGRGIDRIREAGIPVTLSILEDEARRLNAPYLMRVQNHRPWIIAKWAMTLDGKIATRTGSSHWVSGPGSRNKVHRLRARMDAIMVGVNTAIADDCQLTVRLDPSESDSSESNPFELSPLRCPTRIVLDSDAKLPLESALLRTAKETPVLVAVQAEADPARLKLMENCGCEIFRCPVRHELHSLLNHLAQQGVTNLLVEGGSELFGSLLDQDLIDEVHAFIAPSLVGGSEALSPIAGLGLANMAQAIRLTDVQMEPASEDIHLTGLIRRI